MQPGVHAATHRVSYPFLLRHSCSLAARHYRERIEADRSALLALPDVSPEVVGAAIDMAEENPDDDYYALNPEMATLPRPVRKTRPPIRYQQ
jgi:hypothetical protein